MSGVERDSDAVVGGFRRRKCAVQLKRGSGDGCFLGGGSFLSGDFGMEEALARDADARKLSQVERKG